MVWGVSTLLVGGLFGWLTPGLHNRNRVLWIGLGLGLVVAVVLVLVGSLVGSPPLGIGTALEDVVASVIGMTVFFVVGVWAGDVLQRYRVVAD